MPGTASVEFELQQVLARDIAAGDQLLVGTGFYRVTEPPREYSLEPMANGERLPGGAATKPWVALHVMTTRMGVVLFPHQPAVVLRRKP